MIESPHHIMRDAPAATTWWFKKAAERIDTALPDELENIAKEIVPFAWGGIRKVRGGISAKKAWLRWALSMQRIIAIRATDADWGDDTPGRYGIEEPDPIAIYRPLVEAICEAHPNETAEQIAKRISAEIGGEDWRDTERGTAIVGLLKPRTAL